MNYRNANDAIRDATNDCRGRTSIVDIAEKSNVKVRPLYTFLKKKNDLYSPKNLKSVYEHLKEYYPDILTRYIPEDETISFNEEEYQSLIGYKKIAKVKLDGEVIKTYRSIRQAALELKVDDRVLGRAVKEGSIYKGYYWRRVKPTL